MTGVGLRPRAARLTLARTVRAAHSVTHAANARAVTGGELARVTSDTSRRSETIELGATRASITVSGASTSVGAGADRASLARTVVV